MTKEEVFNAYVNHYDVSDGKVRLKIVHTYHVMALAKKIAQRLHLSQEDIELAELIGLLHDIGRFEQLRKYNDFRDYLTEDHAELSVKVLKENNLIRQFRPDPRDDDIIFAAIANHNKLSVEEGLNERQLLHAGIIRDADKTDIYRVRVEDAVSDVLPCTQEEVENSLITPAVYETFMQGKCIPGDIRKLPLDYWVSGLAMVFDYNYLPSLEILKESNLLQKNFERFHYNPQAETILLKAQSFVDDKIQELAHMQ